MYREILERLSEWKDKEDKSPLVIYGTKGVGKSYTVNDFGEGFYISTVIIDLENTEYSNFIFGKKMDREEILKFLGLFSGTTPVLGETLIVFENIQKLDELEEKIKMICDELRGFDLIFTSAIKLSHMKKTESIEMYPLSFKEFLINQKQSSLCDKIEKDSKSINFNDKMLLEDFLKKYFIIGGLPVVVRKYIETGSINEAVIERDTVLNSILEEFNVIESKQLKEKVVQIYKSIGTQLEKDNKKFQYGYVKLTARAREYQEALNYLIDNNYINQVNRLNSPEIPVKDNIDDKSFEVYLPDVGILSALFGINEKDIDDVFLLHNKALVYHFIYEELYQNKNISRLFYWISSATAKIDYLFEESDMIIPIEVNLSENHKMQSLKVYKNRYDVKMSIRITEDLIEMENDILKVPLFAIWNL